MKTITTFENAITNRISDLSAEGINPTAFWAYRKSCEAGNDMIDFGEVIWQTDVAGIAETFKREGITEFTISSTFSNLIDTLAAFEAYGFKMAGLTTVKAVYKDWQTGEQAKLNAIHMMSI